MLFAITFVDFNAECLGVSKSAEDLEDARCSASERI
jgi:hypothetical protein